MALFLSILCMRWIIDNFFERLIYIFVTFDKMPKSDKGSIMKKEDKVTRISLSLDEPLLEYIDGQVENSLYPSRSEFIRDLVRQKMVTDKWDSEEDSIGVLSILYDHHHNDLSDKMNEIQHNKLSNVNCSLHMHVTHHDCLEVIIIKGKPSEIERIASEISSLKGVKHANLSKTAVV